jgi:hypothetical protein
MIQSGGWSRMRTADEHTKLARAAIDFYPDLDPAFEVNVAKFRVTLPPELKDQLEEPVDRLVKRAKTVYGGQKNVGSRGSLPSGANGNLSHGSGISKSTSRANSSEAGNVSLKNALEQAAADAGEVDAFKKIVRALVKRFPEVRDEFGF